MNEYLFTYYMARLIDEMKIMRIKDATLKMVVLNGYGGASISKIAKEAGVAEGYLYRYYKSKSDLVNDLLYINVNSLADRIEELLDGKHTVWNIIENVIETIFKIAKNDPNRIKFLFVLMNDYNFNIQEQQRERIFDLCRRLKEIGVSGNDFRKDITEEEIYLIGVNYPIQFINLRLKNYFKCSEFGDNEIKQVLQICINSLKN
ncbi:MAG: TetR/AcrR family transcriptional regulator [Bacteroidota bacterium]|nr:TetR/AcrR family transcriptional regulator [Bacteroidota bacterium]